MNVKRFLRCAIRDVATFKKRINFSKWQVEVNKQTILTK